MNKNIKNLLKTTAAVATLMMGSQTWGAESLTEYIVGIENGAMRSDSIHLGDKAGNFNGYSAPSSKVKTLYINLTSTADSKGVANGATTSLTALPDTIKELWILGDATTFDECVDAQNKALPTPPENTIIHFALTTAPGAAPTSWFCSSIPTSCTIYVEPGSADPLFSWTGAYKKLYLGIPKSLAAATYNYELERHPLITESLANTKSLVTSTGALVFSKKVKGVSFAGANTLTFNESAEVVDPAAAVSGFTVAPGKKLTLIRNNTTGSQAVTALTLNTGAKLEVVAR